MQDAAQHEGKRHLEMEGDKLQSQRHGGNLLGRETFCVPHNHIVILM